MAAQGTKNTMHCLYIITYTHKHNRVMSLFHPYPKRYYERFLSYYYPQFSRILSDFVILFISQIIVSPSKYCWSICDFELNTIPEQSTFCYLYFFRYTRMLLQAHFCIIGENIARCGLLKVCLQKASNCFLDFQLCLGIANASVQ